MNECKHLNFFFQCYFFWNLKKIILIKIYPYKTIQYFSCGILKIYSEFLCISHNSDWNIYCKLWEGAHQVNIKSNVCAKFKLFVCLLNISHRHMLPFFFIQKIYFPFPRYIVKKMLVITFTEWMNLGLAVI